MELVSRAGLQLMKTPASGCTAQWVMKNCSDPQYIIRPDINTFGHKIIVHGEVEDQLATEYLLKWGK